VLGLAPDLGTTWLTDKVSKKLGLSGRQRDPAQQAIPMNLSLLLIEGLTDAKRDRLQELDLDSCQVLAERNPFLIYARTSYQLMHVVDWMAQAQLIGLSKDDGIKKLRAIGVRDIFALEIGLAGGSKAHIAKVMGIPEATADDVLKYIRLCPAFARLKEVACSLVPPALPPGPQPEKQGNNPVLPPEIIASLGGNGTRSRKAGRNGRGSPAPA
jgi:hypothetical protein